MQNIYDVGYTVNTQLKYLTHYMREHIHDHPLQEFDITFDTNNVVDTIYNKIELTIILYNVNTIYNTDNMPVPLVIVICIVGVVIVGMVAEAIYTSGKNIIRKIKPPLSKSEYVDEKNWKLIYMVMKDK